MRLLSHIIDSVNCNHRYEQCPKDARAREISTRLNQIWQVFDGLNQGFGGVANTIKNLIIVAAGVIGGPVHWCKTVYRLMMACKQHKRRWRRSGSTEAANKVLVNCTIRCLVSQSLSRRLKSSLYIIRLWAHGTAGYTRRTLGRLSIVSGANFKLALVFGQVTSRGAILDKMLWLINNIPLTRHLGQEVPVFLWKKAAGKINGGR